MKLIGLSLLVLLACGEKGPPPSKAGTQVLSWKLADSDRENIKAGKVSDAKAVDIDYVSKVSPFHDETVKVKVHLETATVVFQEDGKEVTHATPIKMDVTVIDANGYQLTGGTCLGPSYDLNLPPSRDMIMFCTVKAKAARKDLGFMIYAYGDGRIDDGKPKTQNIK